MNLNKNLLVNKKDYCPSVVVLVYKYGLIIPNMLGFGRKTVQMVLGDFITRMETFTKVTGLTIKHLVMECIFRVRTRLFMKGNG
jgi:hypothetical protein